MSTYAAVLPSPQEKMREGPRDAETVRHERRREKKRERIYIPKKSFWQPRKTNQEDGKLGDESERHLVTQPGTRQAFVKVSSNLESFKEIVINWFKVIVSIYYKVLNGLNECGPRSGERLFQLCFVNQWDSLEFLRLGTLSECHNSSNCLELRKL